VKFPDILDQLPADPTAGGSYGEPYQTPDGATVIPVARIRERRGRTAQPLGVFVIHGEKARWIPAVDGNRIALVGALTGLLSAVIATLAVLRQPPWPLITITENK
jgi:hypothetical protein